MNTLPLIVLLAATAALEAPGRSPGLDLDLARQYFREAQDLCRRDNGRLWGIPLDGPMMFVHPQTRMIAANEADREGRLTREGDVYVGRLPEMQSIANTAVSWAGVNWTMLVWPLPDDPRERAALMMHESWHRIQAEIGFPPSLSTNDHLDTLEGRVWLQLEWNALLEALALEGGGRRQAAGDALIFRAHRRSLFPGAAEEERLMEMHEGLAEYTGVKLCGLPDGGLAGLLEGRLSSVRARPSFVRSFAYWSGPAYGLLLDGLKAGWRSELAAGDDLGDLLRKALAAEFPEDVSGEAESRAARYGSQEVRKAEEEREAGRRKRAEEFRAFLVDGPILVIPLQKMNMQFNPSQVFPLEGHGAVYPTMRITDHWGILEVSGGALLSPDWKFVRVSAPEDLDGRPLRGRGWTLELNPGWTVAPGGRVGDLMIVTNR
jgi:hypothetical protein